MSKGSSSHAGQAEVRVEKINLSPCRVPFLVLFESKQCHFFYYLLELMWGGVDKNPTGGVLSDRYGAGGKNF